MRIVILGSGAVQLEAVEYLLEKNNEVHILSNQISAKLPKTNFYFEEIDICDRKSVLRYCISNKIESVYSVGSDFGLLTSCYVSEKLGLTHFVSYRIAQLLQNKKEFRHFLQKNDISILHFRSAKTLEELQGWNIFPCVIKPVDSQGQRGVTIVESKEQLIQAFQCAYQYSTCKEVIVEEYISGSEISVNIFVEEGKIEHFFITDRILAKETKMGIPWRHLIPSVIQKHLVGDVFIMCKSVIEKIGIENGPIYFQMKYNGDSIKIIEVTPRLDGCHLWRLIFYNSGVNLMVKTLNKIIGISDKTIPVVQNNGKYLIEFGLQKPGEPFSEKMNQFLYRIPYYQPGDIVQPVNGVLEKTVMYIKKE